MGSNKYNTYNSQIKIFVHVGLTNSNGRATFRNTHAPPGGQNLFRTTRTKNNKGIIREGPLYETEFKELAELIAAHRKS